MKRLACHVMLWLALAHAGGAGAGVLASATRVIFQDGQAERSLMLANTNAYPVVVQTWVDRGEGAPDGAPTPFVVLPAVFRLQPGGIQGLRVLYAGDALPQDRESVFWLNLYEIPPAATGEQARQPRVEMAMNTQLKIFYRPAGLARGAAPAAPRFCVRQQAGEWQLVSRNDTPYHVSFTTLAVAGAGVARPVRQEPDMMLAPFGERAYRLGDAPPPANAGVQYTYVDDAGFPVDGTARLDQCAAAAPG